MSPCPAETFPALEAIPAIRAAFLQRCPGIDVLTDRETALRRLWSVHHDTARTLGFTADPFATAQQVHGHLVTRVDTASEAPAPDADGLITATPGLTLAIYVADCAAVYLVDPVRRAIGLVHSGKKGTEQNITGHAIDALQREYGSDPRDLIIQIAPCIRPPHYEIDFAAQIVRQAREAGVKEVHDSGTCTASDPERYYSYRRELGKTGRLLALLALV